MHLVLSFLWAIAQATAMDAYSRFQTILYKWLRYLNMLMGQDILRPNFHINILTMVGILCSVALPFSFLWTAYFSDDKFNIEPAAYIGIGFQVN